MMEYSKANFNIQRGYVDKTAMRTELHATVRETFTQAQRTNVICLIMHYRYMTRLLNFPPVAETCYF